MNSSVPVSSSDSGPLIFLIAGEPSGDLLGGRLMVALKTATGGRVRFAGIGGEAMEAQGLRSLFPLSDLAVMGIVEVVPHVPKILRRVRETAEAAKRLRPDAIVTIDAPAFAFRVGKKLKGSGIPLIHYVAPSVWAWRPRRARMIAGFLDHLLAFLPFEPPYFTREGLATTFVGHPALEAPKGDGVAFRIRHGLSAAGPVLALLPGSRRSEVKRLLPIFQGTLVRLAERVPDLSAVVPTVPTVAAEVRAAAAHFPLPTIVVEADEKYDAFAASNVALAASGTVVLELAVAEVPTVMTYRVAPLSAWVVRRMVRVRFASLVNLVLDREAIPEMIQERSEPAQVGAELARLLESPDARTRQRKAFAEVVRALKPMGSMLPSEHAAGVVLDLARRGKR